MMFKFASKLLYSALGTREPLSLMHKSLLDLKRYFEEHGVSEVNWKDLFRDPEWNGLCQRTKVLLDPIRGTSAKLRPEHIDKAIERLMVKKNPETGKEEPNKPPYSMSYGPWNTNIYPEALDVSYRHVEERVMRINRAAELTKDIERDPLLKQWVQLAEMTSRASGHSTETGTVGWIRIDEINDKYLLVDEIQSDIVNAIHQAKLYLESDSFQDFQQRVGDNPVFWNRWRQMIGNGGESFIRGMKRQLQGLGFTPESLEEVKRKLNTKFREWAEVGMATLLELAREEGIGMVLINVEQVYTERDPNFGTEKYMKMYKTVADKLGFKPVTINTPEISGNFLGRKP